MPSGRDTPSLGGSPVPVSGLRTVSTVVRGLYTGSGNRCGHDPRAPRGFTPPPQHQPRPLLLRRLRECLQRYYEAPAAWLPSLNAANGSPRQQRSERREGCLALLSSLLHYLDLASLRVGLPHGDGGFSGLAMPQLATVAGLGLRRAERACHDLVAAGLITVYPIAQQDAGGNYRGLPAIRTLSASLFKVFGLHTWLRHERDKAGRRRRRQQREASAAEQGRQELAIAAAAQRADSAPTPTEATPPPAEARRAHARQAIAAIRSTLRARPPPTS